MSDHYLQVFSLTQSTFFLKNDKNIRLLGRKGLQQVAEVICHLIGPFCPHLSTGRYGIQPCQIFHKEDKGCVSFVKLNWHQTSLYKRHCKSAFFRHPFKKDDLIIMCFKTLFYLDTYMLKITYFFLIINFFENV